MTKRMTIIPMGNANVPFPRQYHHEHDVDDDFPAFQLGLAMNDAVVLAQSHPNYGYIASRPGFFYQVMFRDK